MQQIARFGGWRKKRVRRRVGVCITPNCKSNDYAYGAVPGQMCPRCRNPLSFDPESYNAVRDRMLAQGLPVRIVTLSVWITGGRK
jgi:hypothetical protein